MRIIEYYADIGLVIAAVLIVVTFLKARQQDINLKCELQATREYVTEFQADFVALFRCARTGSQGVSDAESFDRRLHKQFVRI